MAKASGAGATRMPTHTTAYLTLWLGGDKHAILSWKMPIANHPPPPGIECGRPLFDAVAGLRLPLARVLQTVRSSASPITVSLATPLGSLPCLCTPVQPVPPADPIICSIPLAFFADDKAYAHPISANGIAEEDLLTDTLRAFPVLAMQIDLAGRIMAINARLCELMGVAAGQVLPLTMPHTHPAWQRWENDAPYRWCDLPPARVLQTQHPVEDFMLYGSPQTGERIPFLAKAQPLYDGAGAFSGVAWLLLPITMKVYADGIAHRRATQILSVVESIREGIMLYDAQGNLWLMNPAAREMLGWDRLVIDPIDSPIGFRSRAYASQLDDGRPITDEDWPMSHALHGESTEVMEVSMKRMDGVRINVGISASPLHDTEGNVTGAVAVIRDMSMHHRFEKMREGFMNLASHELRTPLTSLALVQRILQTHLTRTNAPQTLLDLNSDLLSQLIRLNHLVDNMLDMTGLTGGQFELRPQRTDIAKLVHAVIAEIHLLHKRAPRTFLTQGLEKSCWLYVDPDRLGQVIYNLIANAIKFSTAEKPIEIELHDFMFEDAPWLAIDIIDGGIGIPEEQQPTLFDQVVETEEVNRSSGMGYSLYLARAIIEAHGGTIIVNSVFNLGSTFSVRLPIVPLPPELEDA